VDAEKIKFHIGTAMKIKAPDALVGAGLERHTYSISLWTAVANVRSTIPVRVTLQRYPGGGFSVAAIEWLVDEAFVNAPSRLLSMDQIAAIATLACEDAEK
jgi:hypothetical protein